MNWLKDSKYGQLSIVFVIVGVMLAGAVVTLLMQKNVREQSSDADRIRENVFNERMELMKAGFDACLRESSWNGLVLLGNNGGFIRVPPVANLDNRYSFWYLDEVNVQPTMEEVRNRLNEYVQLNLPPCMNAQVSYDDVYGLDVESIVVNSTFDAGSVSIQVHYPITVTKDTFSRTFTDYEVHFPLRFRRMFELATQVNTRLFDPDFEFGDPLKNVELFDLSSEFRAIPAAGGISNILLFNITDLSNFNEGTKDFRIQFAARLRRNSHARTIDIEKPFFFGLDFNDPFRITSLDQRAFLALKPFSFASAMLPVSVVQEYPFAVTRTQIPVKVENGNIQEYKSYEYNTRQYPVYSYSPPVFFSIPETWSFYWDSSSSQPQKFPLPVGKVGVLLFDGMNWQPIPSTMLSNPGSVRAEVSSLGKLVVADCAFQAVKQATAIKKEDEGQSCMTIIPLCDQQITVNKDEDKASGKCVPGDGTINVYAGQSVNFCADMQACKDKKDKKCKIECTTSYR